jgi:hypothetical protein
MDPLARDYVSNMERRPPPWRRDWTMKAATAVDGDIPRSFSKA